MIDAVRANWLFNECVGNICLIYLCYLLTTGIILIKILQFDGQDSRLQFVKTRVATNIVEDILTRGPIVGNGTNGLSQLIIIGRDGTSIAKGTQVLSWIETVGGSVAEGACFSMRENRIAH